MAERTPDPRSTTSDRVRAPRQRPDEGEVRYRPGTEGEERSIGSLLRELSSEASTLVRQEVELAKTEVSEKIGVFQRNLVSMAIGGAVLVAAIVVLVNAIGNGLIALFEGWVGLETAVWLAPLLLALVLGLVGWSLVKKATSAMKEEGVTPHRTAETLRDDKRWVERKVQG